MNLSHLIEHMNPLSPESSLTLMFSNYTNLYDFFIVLYTVLYHVNILHGYNNGPLVKKSSLVNIPWYLCPHKWILGIKQRIARLQSWVPEKLGNKDDCKRDGSPWEEELDDMYCINSAQGHRGEGIEGCEHEGSEWLSWRAGWNWKVMRDILIDGVITGLWWDLIPG